MAVGIIERALRFAGFNARLNGYGDGVLTLRADLLSRREYPKSAGRKPKDDTLLAKVLLESLMRV